MFVQVDLIFVSLKHSYGPVDEAAYTLLKARERERERERETERERLREREREGERERGQSQIMLR